MIAGEIMKGGLVVGSHNQNELLLIRCTDESTPKALEEPVARNCHICGDEVGLTEEGEVFAGCNECAFPICRACYDYERTEGAQVCPQCNTRLKRLKGCPRVEWGEEEDDKEEPEEDDVEKKLSTPEASDKLLLTDGEAEPSDQLALAVQQQPASRPLDPLSKDLAAYSYGSVSWKEKIKACEDGEKEADQAAGDDADLQLIDEARMPLSRKVQLPSIQINPYRMIILVRLIVLPFFFHYRISNPVKNDRGLWLVSVICEIWFALSWILDQFLKWHPINRETYLDRLSLRYEETELPAVDIFVSTVDPMKEPPLTLANTILSILAVDYPPDKASCYVCDDGAAMLTFEALSVTSQFATKWVPFCHKFNIEPRAPESYFNQKLDYLNHQILPSFVTERRAMKREYEEFKIRINALVSKSRKVPEQGWSMQDGTPWAGNDVKDHPGMIQVFSGQSVGEESKGSKLPHLIYVSRERRPGFNHHKKAGAMNALVRVSGLLTNAPYVLNLDWDQYINNSKALREALCFMLEPLAERRVGYVQFPQSIDGDTNTTYFDIHMKGLDGIQGPVYAGTGSVFRRRALYGQNAPKKRTLPFSCYNFCCIGWGNRKKKQNQSKSKKTKEQGGNLIHRVLTKRTGKKQNKPKKAKEQENEVITSEKKLEKRFGTSPVFATSTLLEEGVTLKDATSLLKEAIHVISCCYEEKTEWGKEIGWIYGSPREDILTSLKLHCYGWRSIYHVPERPVFKQCVKIDMTDRLLKVLEWGMGSIQICLSKHCPLWYGYGRELKFMERIAYINVTIHPFTSLPLLAYSTLPAVCLLSNKFIVAEVNDIQGLWFVALLMCLIGTALLEMRWSCISMDEWWRNEQFWMIRSVSVHVFAVFLGLIKVVSGVDLMKFEWDFRTAVMIMPTSLLIVTMVAIFAGLADAIQTGYGSWGPFLGKLFFALWVVVHLYPFLKGLFSRTNRTPAIVIIWSLLAASSFSLACVKLRPLIVSSSTDPVLVECGLDCNV